MKQGKYYHKKCLYDGFEFDSATERDRYIELKAMVADGEITGLRRQVSFEIIPKLMRKEIVHLKTKDKIVWRVDEQNAVYTCDFMYGRGNQTIIEEVKSNATKNDRDYILRRKLIKQNIARWNEEAGRENYVFNEVISCTTKKKKENGSRVKKKNRR